MEVRTLREIEEFLNEIYSNDLTVYEILNLAIQIQRNEILKAGLVVTWDGDVPTALEAIAMAISPNLVK